MPIDDQPPALSIEQIYGGSAAEDEAVKEALEESLRPRSADMLFDQVAALGIGAGQTILDVGCRDARHTIELARRFSSRVLGVELVQANLDRGRPSMERLRVEEPDVAGRIGLVRATIDRLPFADSSFDLVWARDMLIHVPDLTGALRECRRVLAAGGHVLVFQMFATSWLEPGEAARLWPPLAVVPDNTDPAAFEASVRRAGLEIVRREELRSEWREWGEEQGDRRTSRQLLHAARLLRDPDRFVERFGRAAYEVELGNCLWGVYQMIGKLSPRVYVLRASSA